MKESIEPVELLEFQLGLKLLSEAGEDWEISTHKTKANNLTDDQVLRAFNQQVTDLRHHLQVYLAARRRRSDCLL